VTVSQKQDVSFLAIRQITPIFKILSVADSQGNFKLLLLVQPENYQWCWFQSHLACEIHDLSCRRIPHISILLTNKV